MSEWQPIETAPKYPIDACCGGPHFLAKCSDGYIHEVWWDFPRPGSIAYAENLPAQIQRIDANGFRTEHPTHWMPLPAPPADQGEAE